jgi:hypothetical protein
MAAQQKKKITRRQRLHRLVLALHITAGIFGFVSGILYLGDADTPASMSAGLVRLAAGSLLISALFMIDKTKSVSRLFILLIILQAAAGLLSAVSGSFPFWQDMIRGLLSDALMIVVLLIIRLEKQ